MELKKVRIQNYRSIDDVTIDVVERCLILLGINESGKSNILKAISALLPDFSFNFLDDSKTPVNGNYSDYKEPIVTYTFRLSETETRTVFDKYFKNAEYKNWPITYNNETFNSLPQFLKEFVSEITYALTLTKENSKTTKIDFSFKENSFSIKEKTFFATAPVEGVYEEIKYNYAQGDFIIIDTEVQASSIQGIKRALVEDVHSNIRSLFDEIIKLNLPVITYWRYDSKYLLTEPIALDTFKTNPDSCIPLRNIFHLTGITNIQQTIDEFYNNVSAFHNIKKQLSDAATTHLKKVWKEREYKDVEIIVNESNKNFLVQVKDSKNLYNFNQRSDGFKRFISFLLMLSADYKTNKLLENSILIFDEPDISLHPSGTRHLLKEIIELSKKNYSIVASHSIFFIDRANISRHIIVKKEGENTIVKQANYENFAEEEVLFQALGCSLFDILKENNLCFEGWTDKEVFKIMTELFEDTDIAGLKEFVKNHGILWSSSASKICLTIKPFVGNERRFYAIADEDGPGKAEKEIFEEEFKDSGSFFYTYKDLSKRILLQLTLEDLLPEKLMIDFFNEHLKEVLNGTAGTVFSPDKTAKGGMLNAWDSFSSKEHKTIKEKLKTGYKSKIPNAIRNYVNANSGDKDKLKKDFTFYKTFLESLINNTSAAQAPVAPTA
ncbi:MAG: ATP-dependent nuclease [Bacteroidia bacterium]